jgi:hypothetical protein
MSWDCGVLSNTQEKKASTITNRTSGTKDERDAILRTSNISLNPELESLKSASSVDQCGQLRGQFIGFECTLYLTSKKYVCRHKAVINSRIVVIGASRAASSFLQTLMLSTSMWFMNITLISANGFEGQNQHAAAAPIKGSSRRGSSSNSKLTPLINPLEFDPGPSESFWKLGLDCAVKLIIGVVGGIDRKKKTVSLLTKEINNEVTYDWLVLATGLQDQTRHALGLCTLTHGLKGVIRAQELAADHCELGSGINLYFCNLRNSPLICHHVYFCNNSHIPFEQKKLSDFCHSTFCFKNVSCFNMKS